MFSLLRRAAFRARPGHNACQSPGVRFDAHDGSALVYEWLNKLAAHVACRFGCRKCEPNEKKRNEIEDKAEGNGEVLRSFFNRSARKAEYGIV